MTVKEQIRKLVDLSLNPYKIAREVYGPRPTKAQEQHVYQVCRIYKLEEKEGGVWQSLLSPNTTRGSTVKSANLARHTAQ